MDLKIIETFLCAAELESFTKTADELNYVQSTVTSQIQQLERELGFPLFDRVGRHVTLTSLGREFLSHANQLKQIWLEAGALGKNMEERNGILRIGVLESLLFGTMPDVLSVFRNHYQNVEIQIKMGQAVDLLTLLKQNRLDLVYISDNWNTEPDLTRCYARREDLIFLAAPGHPLAGKAQIPLAEFLHYDLVATERSGFCYHRLSELAATQKLMPRHCIMVDSTVAVAALTGRGMGVCFLPEYSVAQQIQERKLVKLDIAVLPQSYFSQILYYRDKWIAPFVDGFVKILRDIRPEIGDRE